MLTPPLPRPRGGPGRRGPRSFGVSLGTAPGMLAAAGAASCAGQALPPPSQPTHLTIIPGLDRKNEAPTALDRHVDVTEVMSECCRRLNIAPGDSNAGSVSAESRDVPLRTMGRRAGARRRPACRDSQHVQPWFCGAATARPKSCPPRRASRPSGCCGSWSSAPGGASTSCLTWWRARARAASWLWRSRSSASAWRSARTSTGALAAAAPGRAPGSARFAPLCPHFVYALWHAEFLNTCSPALYHNAQACAPGDYGQPRQ